MITPSRFLQLGMLPIIAAASWTVAAQDVQEQPPTPTSRTEAMQIEAPAPVNRRDTGKAYLEATAAAPQARQIQAGGNQIPGQNGKAPTRQISATSQSSSVMAQLSKADLDATLAQLSAAERRVLLQAIEGTDICDNPPRVPAVIALCQNRLETRSREFTAEDEGEPSAEESLLRANFEHAGLPSVGQVIDRLARTNAATDDFSNQAIASIALGSSITGAKRPDAEEQPTSGLAEETQALVNAIINQLGGRAP